MIDRKLVLGSMDNGTKGSVGWGKLSTLGY